MKHQPDDYVIVVATDASAAMRFFGRSDQPVDLGPPLDPSRYRPGARRWGFAKSGGAPPTRDRASADARVLAKVRKLLTLAGNGAATEGEASNAAAAAQRLIEEHRLDEALLDAGESSEADVPPPLDEPIRNDHDPVDKLKSRVAWRGSLAQGIANANGCRMFWRAGRTIHVIGTPSRVAAVRTLYAWLSREVDRLGSEAARGRGRAYGHAWRVGCAERLAERLGEAARQGAAEAKAKALQRLQAETGGAITSTSMTGLARIEKATARVNPETERARVNAWMNASGFTLKKPKGRTQISNASGYAAGKDAANQIRLTGHAALGRGAAGKLGGGR